MLPNDSISLFYEISGTTSQTLVSGTSHKTIIAVSMQQSKDLSDTILLCGTDILAKNYAKDLPQNFINYQCNDDIIISKTGNDLASVIISYVPYYTSDFATWRHHDCVKKSLNDVIINEVASVLQQACIASFGTTWSNDIARSFALLAIAKYLEMEEDEFYKGSQWTKKQIDKFKGNKQMTRKEAEKLVCHYAYHLGSDSLFH